jgi:adenylate kinase
MWYTLIMNNAYIFYGKAGSGKGTQAKKLETYLTEQGNKVLVIETGKLFRDFVAKEHSFAAHRTQSIIDAGQLMPAFFPIYLWAQEIIEKYKAGYDVILDGVTRRIEEAPILESALHFLAIEKSIAFHIHVSDEVAQQRLVLRPDGRADDQDPARVQQRLDWYRENVLPVLEYYKKGSVIQVVDVDYFGMDARIGVR